MTTARFLANTFLFRGMDESEITAVIGDCTVERHFERGELIYSCDSYDKMLGFVLDGECEVVSKNNRVPLNTLPRYSSFGITAIFSEDEFPTCVYAKRAAKVLFIKKDDLYRMMDICPDISKNIIVFLTGRITFLNRKITTFSAESVEKKIAVYLLEKQSALGDTFELNLKHTAEEISAGRASLYRALGALENDGIITRNAKQITLIDPNGLERITKQ